jgi:hypothetical protein
MLCLVVIGSASENWPRMQTTSAHTYQTISGRFSNRGGFFNMLFFGNKHLENYLMSQGLVHRLILLFFLLLTNYWFYPPVLELDGRNLFPKYKL